jgi:hypothetical protein
MTWFEQLFGVPEVDYDETAGNFAVHGTRLRSLANGRDFAIGRFSTPSLASLRSRGRQRRRGRLSLRHEVIGDVLELHAQPDNADALFQVASQFNCLEFAGPDELPEHGVTRYDDDPTQGPACALAAAAATVYRNYFAPVAGKHGQRHDCQLNNLDDVQRALGAAGSLVEVRNGYTFSNADKLSSLNTALHSIDREAMLGQMKIGLQQGVGVTFAERFVEPPGEPRVSQAFCSALSCGYTGGGLELWAPLARLVLDAAYEATLWAAVVDASEGVGSGKIWLTFLGGGAFGNDKRWIAGAIRRAVARLIDHDLDVRVAHHRRIDETMRAIIDG